MADDREHVFPERDEVFAICDGRHGDPFALLGPHQANLVSGKGSVWVVRALLHYANAADLLFDDGTRRSMYRVYDNALFEAVLPDPAPKHYRIAIGWPGGYEQIIEDPYRFGPIIDDFELHILAEGRHRELSDCLGANLAEIDGVAGVRFAVWAPNAQRVSVVGDFNGWDGRRHLMRLRHYAGTWELFIPGLGQGHPLQVRSDRR